MTLSIFLLSLVAKFVKKSNRNRVTLYEKGCRSKSMEAYKIKNYIIAADLPEDAQNLFVHELGGTLPVSIEEIGINEKITREDGRVMTIKEIINEELDNRQQWQRMGVPCDTYRPFVIKKLT